MIERAQRRLAAIVSADVVGYLCRRRPGDRIALTVATDHLHLIDPTTGTVVPTRQK